MKKLIITTLFFILLCSCFFSNETNIFAFYNYKTDRIVKNKGVHFGLGFEVKTEYAGLFATVINPTNFQIGDTKPKWKEVKDLGLDEYYYYPTGESYLWYKNDFIFFNMGYQQLHEGLGKEYPLFLAPNSNPVPSMIFEWEPFEWLKFRQDVVFYRIGLDFVHLEDKSQEAKSVYHRRITITPFENIQVGFSDTVLLKGRSIDVYYLFSPFSYQLAQLARSAIQDAPWKEPINDNMMYGVFFQYSPENWRIYAEALVDDWGSDKSGVTKVAWDTGAELNLDEHVFSFEFAGASRYTFNKSFSRLSYQYVRYEDDPDLPLEYNMIGYKYGENSASVNLRYEFLGDRFSLGGNYEFVTFGERDPFCELPPDALKRNGFTWLEDEVLQRESIVTLFSKWDISPKFALEASVGARFVENENLIKDSKNVYPQFSIYAKYKFPFTDEIVNKIREGDFSDIDIF